MGRGEKERGEGGGKGRGGEREEEEGRAANQNQSPETARMSEMLAKYYQEQGFSWCGIFLSFHCDATLQFLVPVQYH